MSDIQPPKRSIPVAKLIWRFATGLHMDGKHRQNYRTGHVLPQYRNYYWNRYRRWERAWWRFLAVWALSLIGYGLVAYYAITIYCLCAATPFIIAIGIHKFLKHTTIRVRTTTTDGIPISYRTLRPKHYRRLRNIKNALRFKIRPPADAPIPPEWEKPIRAQLTEDGEGDVRVLRRPLEQPKDLDELLKEHGPKGSRETTHKRNANRRLAELCGMSMNPNRIFRAYSTPWKKTRTQSKNGFCTTGGITGVHLGHTSEYRLCDTTRGRIRWPGRVVFADDVSTCALRHNGKDSSPDARRVTSQVREANHGRLAKPIHRKHRDDQ